DQLAEPARDLPAEDDATAGVVAFPGITQQAADDVDLAALGVELEGQDRFAGALAAVLQVDIPALQRPRLPTLAARQQPAAEDLPRARFRRRVAAGQAERGRGEEVPGSQHLPRGGADLLGRHAHEASTSMTLRRISRFQSAWWTGQPCTVQPSSRMVLGRL